MSDFEKKYTDLLNAVASMRNYQKAYFGCRTTENLTYAKNSEKKVDKIIDAERAKLIQLQQTLKF